MAKARTPEFFFDDGSKSLVECLSDGQQFVAFGIHPGTGQPYRWLTRSPLDTAVSDLPVVDAKHVQEFLRQAEAILRQAGGTTAKELRGVAEPTTHQRTVPPRPGDWPRPTRADVESALAAVPNTHDWHGWYKIGAAIFDALGTEGEEIFVKWSAQSCKDVPANIIEKYRSFRRSAPTVTAASLFYEARNNGWLSERELERARAEDLQQRQVGDPRRKETARAAFRMLRMGVPSDELLAVLHEQNHHRSEPLPQHIVDDTAIWAAQRLRGRAHAG